MLNVQECITMLCILSSVAFGKVAGPRIIGGSDTNKRRFDYAQVSLQLSGTHICGGILVSSNLVLTAAHCHKSFDTIVVNTYNLSDTAEARLQYKPRNFVVHPDYDEKTDTHDAMIAELDGIVDTIDPVVINNSSAVPTIGDRLLVLGWGMTSPGDDSSYASILQQAELDYIPNEACKSMTNINGQSLGQWILEDHLCAWKAQTDACMGDSGSPLILAGHSNQEDILVGIVSWGVDCAGPFPGVYGRTSYMHDWLEKVICARSKTPPGSMTCKTDYNTETTNSTLDGGRCSGCRPEKTQEEDASSNRKSDACMPDTTHALCVLLFLWHILWCLFICY